MTELRTSLFEFEWERSSQGHEITEKIIPASPTSAARTVMHRPEPTRRRVIRALGEKSIRYSPFQTPDIARRFADTAPQGTGQLNEDLAVRFSNDFGLPGIQLIGRQIPQDEDLELWAQEASRFRAIYDLYDARLESHSNLSRALTAYNEGTAWLKLAPTISTEEVRKDFRFLSFRPLNLFSAMWLILGGEITASINLKKCQNPGCPEWFVDRSNKIYCCTNCRVSGNRKKLRFFGSSSTLPPASKKSKVPV